MLVNKRSIRIRIISKLNGIYLSPLCLSIPICCHFLPEKRKKETIFSFELLRCAIDLHTFISNKFVFLSFCYSIGFYQKSFSLCSPIALDLLKQREEETECNQNLFFVQEKYVALLLYLSDD